MGNLHANLVYFGKITLQGRCVRAESLSSDFSWYEEKCESLFKILILHNLVSQLLKYSPGEKEQIGRW